MPEITGYDKFGSPIYDSSTSGGGYPLTANGLGNVVGLGYGETDPRARQVLDFAPIFDVMDTRTQYQTGDQPYGSYVPSGYWNTNQSDPLYAVATAPSFNSSTPQFNALSPAFPSAYQNYRNGLDAFSNGNMNYPDMTNAGISAYGVFGPYGELQGISQGADQYANSLALARSAGQLSRGENPLTINQHVFNADPSYPAFDQSRGVIDATTGYFRNGFAPFGQQPLAQPLSVYDTPNFFDGTYGPQLQFDGSYGPQQPRGSTGFGDTYTLAGLGMDGVNTDWARGGTTGQITPRDYDFSNVNTYTYGFTPSSDDSRGGNGDTYNLTQTATPQQLAAALTADTPRHSEPMPAPAPSSGLPNLLTAPQAAVSTSLSPAPEYSEWADYPRYGGSQGGDTLGGHAGFNAAFQPIVDYNAARQAETRGYAAANDAMLSSLAQSQAAFGQAQANQNIAALNPTSVYSTYAANTSPYFDFSYAAPPVFY